MKTINEIREVSGISRVEFSRKYGIPVRTIEDWEAGRRKCTEYVTNLLYRVVMYDKKELKKQEEIIMKKIDQAIEEKMMKTGAMGTETVTVEIELSNEEKSVFLESDKYDSDNYAWELEGNTLTISYTEEVEG